jgi:5-methylcytosine-specific restriction endonuclease McrA
MLGMTETQSRRERDNARYHRLSPEQKLARHRKQVARILASPEILERVRARQRSTGLSRADWLEHSARQKAQRLAARIAAREAAQEIRRAEALSRRAAVKERQREVQRNWRLANPGRMLVLRRRWKVENADQVKASNRIRKQTKVKSLRDDLVKLQRGRCGYCRVKLSAVHIDHIEPLARGGADKRHNLQALCPTCNLAKSAKDPIDYARETGRLL